MVRETIHFEANIEIQTALSKKTKKVSTHFTNYLQRLQNRFFFFLSEIMNETIALNVSMYAAYPFIKILSIRKNKKNSPETLSRMI